MTIKSAQNLIEEFIRAVRPPQGCAIVLTEIVPSPGFNFNLVSKCWTYVGCSPGKVRQRADRAETAESAHKLGRRD